MVPHFPRWIWSWAALLPAVAGSVNATALLSLRHVGVTHLTGISTEAGIGLGAGDVDLLAHAAGVIASFTLGCAMSATVARGPRWTPSIAAAGLLFGVALLLSVASLLLPERPWLGVMLCAGAMGIQNGLTSALSGALLRTSHLTGMFTDLGIALGQKARGAPVDARRVAVCLTVITSFVVGAVTSAMAYATWQGRCLSLSAAFAAVVGLSTLWLSRRAKAAAGITIPRE